MSGFCQNTFLLDDMVQPWKASDMTPRVVVKNGHTWRVRNEDAAFWDRVEQGHWEPMTFSVFDRFLDAKHSYIDVGAWIGPTVLYGASLARHCYALEPDPVAFRKLRENVALNPSIQPRITLSEKCLTVTCDPVTLWNKTSLTGGDSRSSLLFAGSKVQWEAQGITLERFLSDNAIGDCSFIKMDIEGGEFDLLPAIASYLADQRPTLYLSLHPHLLTEPASKIEMVEEVLACYRKAYTPALKEVALETICSPGALQSRYELVLTDIETI
jgi:FkbM family methyltransferase